MDTHIAYPDFDRGEHVTMVDSLQHRHTAELADAALNNIVRLSGKQPAAAVVAGQLPTPAAPDFPAALGWSIIGLYAAIMLDFTLFFTGSASAAFMVGVSIAYVVVYLSVPVAFMRIERTDQPRISLGRFLKEGVDTWTGHLSGREAIAQVLLIPAVLTIAIFLIGIAWQVAR